MSFLVQAEEMELKKKNKSYKLLNEEEFVVLLFQIRDRFMSMVSFLTINSAAQLICTHF